MGLLDPKLDKERAFALLAKKGAIKAEVRFSGGHDEGSVEDIILTKESGATIELEPWYCGGYTWDPVKNDYKPMSAPENEDHELADLLEGPINEEFDSWGGVEYTNGVLTWLVPTPDLPEGGVKMNYSQDQAVDHEYEVFS